MSYDRRYSALTSTLRSVRDSFLDWVLSGPMALLLTAVYLFAVLMLLVTWAFGLEGAAQVFFEIAAFATGMAVMHLGLMWRGRQP